MKLKVSDHPPQASKINVYSNSQTLAQPLFHPQSYQSSPKQNARARAHTHTQPKQNLTRNKKKTTSDTTQKHTQIFPLAINNPSPKPSP